MKLVEFYRGTPQQRDVLQKASGLPTDRPLKAPENVIKNQARIAQRTLNRRRFSTLAAGLTLATVSGIAYELQPEPTPLYDGPIDALQGLPLLDDEKIQDLAETLHDTKSPLLEKVADGLVTLTKADQNPSEEEMPSWVVRADSFPLPVAYTDATNVSWALISGDIPDASKGTFHLFVPGDNQSYEFPYIQPYNLGIKLATAGLQGNNKYGEAIVVAKEYITLMLRNSCMKNAGRYLDSLGFTMTDLQNNPLTNERDHQRAASSVFNAASTDPSRIQWAIIDAAPILLLQAAVQDGRSRGGNCPYFPDLDDVAERHLMGTDGAFTQTNAVMNEWTQNPYRFVPHDNIIFEAFDLAGPLSTATLSLANELYQQDFR